MSNDYQPITATPQRTFFRFAAQGENVVAFRCTIPRSEFEGDVGAHPLGCQIVAEQLIWAALAEASLRPGHDDHVDVGLPDCVDAPIPGNSKVVLLQPTTLSAAQVSENLVAVRETITSMRASWPASYRLAEAWIGAALAKDNALGRGDVRLLRAALYPLSALGASQSEDAVVPPGSVGFARFLPTRVTFHGTPAPTVRRPANFMEAVVASLTGELPGSNPFGQEAPQGTEAFEFPEPCAIPSINTDTPPTR